MFKALVEKIKSFRNRDFDVAFDELRRRLKEKGYDTDQPPDEDYPEYRAGMKVLVVISGPNGKEIPHEELKNKALEIRAVNVDVAKRYGLIWQGVVTGVNYPIYIYCGFRSFV